MKIYGKLQEVRCEIHNKIQSGEIEKGGFNSFFGAKGGKYIELGDFISDAMALCKINGITPVFNFDGVQATLKFYSWDSEETLDFVANFGEAAKIELGGDGRTKMSSMQKMGSCLTYARRYLWINALELAIPDEIDSAESSKKRNLLEGQPKNLSSFEKKIEATEKKIKSIFTLSDLATCEQNINDNKESMPAEIFIRLKKLIKDRFDEINNNENFLQQ